MLRVAGERERTRNTAVREYASWYKRRASEQDNATPAGPLTDEYERLLPLYRKFASICYRA